MSRTDLRFVKMKERVLKVFLGVSTFRTNSSYEFLNVLRYLIYKHLHSAVSPVTL